MSGEAAESDRKLFISRELSWLDFNSRVLDEAEVPANPLLERIKFIAITSGNLDEFFMVRIAGLRQLVRSGRDLPDPAGNRPSRELELARRKIERLLRKQYRLLHESILPALEEHSVALRRPSELGVKSREYLTGYFSSKVFPVLSPLAVDAAHPFPLLNSGSVEIALSLRFGNGATAHGFVEVPEVLDRFIPVPGSGHTYVLLEDLIIENLPRLFPDAEILESLAFRITRDMDLVIDDESVVDLVSSIGKTLKMRRHRDPIRLEYAGSGRGELAEWLRDQLNIEDLFIYRLRGPLHLKQFFELAAKARMPELIESSWPPAEPAEFSLSGSIFSAIDKAGSILLAPPFHSFSPLVRLLEEAAQDPDVLAIKQTLYRVSGNSPVVRALQRAAERGKQVTVVVELKARFDEGNNIEWARRLDESGAHVVYGVAGLKVHCKALLIVRREEGELRRYVHLGTGNYNDKTAALYTDCGILSNDPELCFDVGNLFNTLTGYSSPGTSWCKLAAAPFSLRARIESLIRREIDNVRAGAPGRIIAKMNSLSDEKIIRLLHEAADAGVEIQLIVRGICCLRPRPGVENLRIISIVDRYLEHSRVMIFHNHGDEEYYLSSADWMTRNLDRRVELLFPVDDPGIRSVLRRMLEFQLADTDKARQLLPTGAYTRVPMLEHYTSSRSQRATSDYLRHLTEEKLRGEPGEPLKVFDSPRE